MEKFRESLWICDDMDLVAECAEERGIKKGIEQGIERGIEKGIEQGIEKGIEQGIEKGKRETLLNIIKVMHGRKLSIKKIAKFTGLTREQISEILENA